LSRNECLSDRNPGVFFPGTKYDEEKVRWDLLPWEGIEDVAKVMTYGAKKYAPDNWQKVKPLRARYFAAALRHIMAWNKEEILDHESGLPHLAHAICCLLFCMWGDNVCLDATTSSPAGDSGSRVHPN
jgi:hypothetical protein